jgi:hypothetical protein
MHSRATDRRSASKCQGKWPDQTLDQAFGLPEVLVAVSTSRLSCKRTGKTRILMPVWDSSGESQFKPDEPDTLLHCQANCPKCSDDIQWNTILLDVGLFLLLVLQSNAAYRVGSTIRSCAIASCRAGKANKWILRTPPATARCSKLGASLTRLLELWSDSIVTP